VRRALVVGVGLLLAGAVVYLWRATFDDPPPHGRRAANGGKMPDEPVPGPAAPILPKKHGVAQAPGEHAAGVKSRAVWYGRAVDHASRAGVLGAAVTLERMPDGLRYSQRPTRDGGWFVARYPDEEPPSAGPGTHWRIAIEAPGGEIGFRVVQADEAANDVGDVFLHGQHTCPGRVLLETNKPAKEVKVYARRFGEIAPQQVYLANAISDGDGRFTLEKLPAGVYVIEGRGPAGRIYLAAPVLVPGDGALVMPIPAQRFRYRVLDSLGVAVAGATTRATLLGLAHNTDPFEVAKLLTPFEGFTQAGGGGVFDHLPPGGYRLAITAQGVTTIHRFDHSVAWRKKPVVFRVPVDPSVALRFVQHPPLDPPAPLAGMQLTMEIDGRKMSYRTDRDGVLRIPRPTKGARIHAITEDRRGFVKLTGSTLDEGRAPHDVGMRLQARDSERERSQKPRRAVVVLPDGSPVAGATVYLEWDQRPRKRVTTNQRGRADLGDAPADAVARLHRADFANGDPASPKLAGSDTARLVWQAGRPIRVKVRDGADGFPLEHVQIGPRPKAWARTGEPGVFSARWDPERPGPIVVGWRGYEPFEKMVEDQEQISVELLPAPPRTATMVLEVRQRNLPAPHVWVHGETLAKVDIPGRTDFKALTGPGGTLVLRALRPGAWKLWLDGRARGSLKTQATLARGRNSYSFALEETPRLTGLVSVVAGRRRSEPLPGATILVVSIDKNPEPGNPVTRAATTDRGGRFVLNVPHKAKYYLVAQHLGLGDHRFASEPGKPAKVVMKPKAMADITFQWMDARSGRVPDDLMLHVSPLDMAVRSVRGRFIFHNLPSKRLRFELRGSAWAPPFSLRLKAGQYHRSTRALQPGGTVEGRVMRNGKGAPGLLLYLEGRQRVPRPARTNDEGEFLVRGLPPGRYRVNIRNQTQPSRTRNTNLVVENARTLPDLMVEVR